MAHLLTPALTNWNKPLLRSPKIGYIPSPKVCCFGHQSHHQASPISQDHALHDSLRRRKLMMGLSGVVMLGLSLSDEENASIGARGPPAPPKEKTDPNVSGVQAKVLASKRRKEAMKEAVAKLREQGKPLNKDPPPPAAAATSQ